MKTLTHRVTKKPSACSLCGNSFSYFKKLTLEQKALYMSNVGNSSQFLPQTWNNLHWSKILFVTNVGKLSSVLFITWKNSKLYWNSEHRVWEGVFLDLLKLQHRGNSKQCKAWKNTSSHQFNSQIYFFKFNFI